MMSVFEVSSTAGTGYHSSNAVTGTKSGKALIDIPANIAVITHDFMEDINSQNTIGDILKYAASGTPPSTNRNNFLQLRGQRFEAPFLDGMRVSNSPNDPAIIDSVEVLKGVNSVLYGTRVPAGGLVNMVSKKPQVQAMTSFNVQYGSFDFRRTEFDTTGAIPGIDKKLTYRIVASREEDDGYQGFRNQNAVAPMLQYSSGNTTIRFQYFWAKTKTPGELPGGIANPDGTPYIGAGRSQDYKAPWSFTLKETASQMMFWIQKFGNWESRVGYAMDRTDRLDEDMRRQGAPNFVTNTSPYRYFGQTGLGRFETIQQDIAGPYELAGRRVDTNFGWSRGREIFRNNKQEIDLATGKAIGAYSRATVATPGLGLLNIANPRLGAVPLPGAADRIVPGQYNDTNNLITNYTAYLVQSCDVVPKKLSLSVGGSYAREKDDTGNLADGTQVAAHRVDDADDWVYAAGAVFHVSSQFNFFAQTGTTFAPNQALAQTPAGLRPPAVKGKSYEAGAKFSFLGGRIWGGITVYQLNLKGYASYNSTINAFVVTDTFNKGAEMDISVEPIQGLQVIATAFTAEVKGPDGTPVNQSFKESWSLWTKYTLSAGRMKGLFAGGGVFHRGTLFFSTGTPSPGYTTIDLIAGYSTKKWSFTVSARNITDALYNIGSTGATNIDISPPMTVRGSLTHRF